uniref:XK-related protein n=1 Tax=Strigamia maritima TaxID=126957 RepID=T1J7N5_STRMM
MGRGRHYTKLDERLAREPKMCRCTSLFAARVIDTALILGLHVVQGSTLNFLLIWHDNTNSTYFWFVADLCVLMITMGALITSYHHVRLKSKRKIQPFGISFVDEAHAKSVPRRGVIPFAYSAWFIYSTFLVAKMGVIFQSGLAASLKPQDSHSPQMICCVLSISAVLFFLQLNSCHSARSGTSRYTALMNTAFATAIEILDSINLFSVLLGPSYELPNNLQTAVLILSSINIVLPTLVFFKFSLSDFGEHSGNSAIDFTHLTLKTLVVDLPFLVIRIYLWSHCVHMDVSPFIVKNLLCLVWWLRYVLPEGIAILRSLLDQVEMPKKGHYTITVHPLVGPTPADSVSTINRQIQGFELNTMSSS